MEIGKNQNERCQNVMEENRDRAAEPALIGIKTHPQHVAKNHCAKIDPAEYFQIPSQAGARLYKVPTAPVKIKADFAEQKDDQELAYQ